MRSWWMLVGSLLLVLLAQPAWAEEASRPTPLRPPDSQLTLALRSASWQRDKAARWALFGPVRSAVRTAVHASALPLESEADLEVVLDENGTVQRIDTHTTRAHAQAYRQLAAAVLADLRQRRIQLPAHARHAKLTLHLASHERLPSGNRAPKTTAQKIVTTLAAALTFEWGDIGARSQRVISMEPELVGSVGGADEVPREPGAAAGLREEASR